MKLAVKFKPDSETIQFIDFLMSKFLRVYLELAKIELNLILSIKGVIPSTGNSNLGLSIPVDFEKISTD